MAAKWALVALVGFVTVAGCVEEPAAQLPPTDVPAVVPITSLAWGLEECKIAVAIFGVPAAKVQPHLPAGFKPLSAAQVIAQEGGAPLMPPNPSNDGNLGLEMFTCKSGTGLDGSIDGLAYGSIFAAVQPPAELVVAGAKHHFVKWEVLIPDAPRRAVLAAAGVPAVDGSASYASYQPVGSGYTFDGTLKLGEQTYTFKGEGAQPAQDGSFVEYTATPGGLVKWQTKYVAALTRVGPMDVTIPSDGLASKIAGPGLQRAAGFLGIVSFRDGIITLPAAAA